MTWKALGLKLSAVGTLLAGGSIATAFLTVVPADAPATWVQTAHTAAIVTIIAGVIMSALGKLISTWLETDAPVETKAPLMPMIIFALLCLGTLTGCAGSVEVRNSQSDIQKAVNATATQDVPFIAKFISDTWADHETAQANRLFNAALAENSVSATIPPALPPAPGAIPQNATIIKVVSEPQRAASQQKHDQDLAQIAIGKQQIYQAVINRFAGNLAAAQALLDGQANYYKTAGQSESTLQAGLDGALAAFQKFAPVIASATSKKK